MISDSFDDGRGTTVPYTETFRGNTPEIGFSASSAVKHDVTNKNVFFSNERAFFWWVNGNFSTGQSLADKIVCISLYLDRNTFRQPSAKALSSGTEQFDGDCIVCKQFAFGGFCQFMRQHCPDDPVDIEYG